MWVIEFPQMKWSMKIWAQLDMPELLMQALQS